MTYLSGNTVTNNTTLQVLRNKPGDDVALSKTDILKNNKVTKEIIDPFVYKAEENAATKKSSNVGVPGIRKASIVAEPDLLDKQLSQLLTGFANLPQQKGDQLSQTMLNGVKELSTTSKFDISSLVGGFTGKMAALLQIVVEAEQKNAKSLAAQANANNIMARAQGENSARNIVKAGEEGRNMVITQSAAGLAATGVSSAMQIKASSQKNSAIKLHAQKENALKSQAATLDSKTAPSKLIKEGDALHSDSQILKATPKNLEFQAAEQKLQYQLRTNDADKLYGQGMALNQIGQNGAAIAAANGQITKAEAESKAALAKSDESIYQAGKDSDERRMQISMQMKAMVMELIAQASQNRANNVSAMANNLKG
ncbi:hypothetical protein [Erwinia tasmaniensis]|uniref:hypothetical protein n=1 Tax=Erwinia tasmaniensis TaxID=338565 RepID=UPI003A4D25FF